MAPNTIVYPLKHEYEHEGQEREVKELGTYTSREKAQAAIERYRRLPGFEGRPDAFVIYESILDRDSAWTEGFIEGNPYD
jgi:hypothetical protein